MAKKEVAWPTIPKKMPANLATVADLAYDFREIRLLLQKKLEAIEEFEKAAKQHLIDNLPKSKAEGISGRSANAKIVRKRTFSIKDKEAFKKMLKRTGEFDLAQISLNKKAVEERYASGKKVAGVEPFDYVSVSLTKL